MRCQDNIALTVRITYITKQQTQFLISKKHGLATHNYIRKDYA